MLEQTPAFIRVIGPVHHKRTFENYRAIDINATLDEPCRRCGFASESKQHPNRERNAIVQYAYDECILPKSGVDGIAKCPVVRLLIVGPEVSRNMMDPSVL